MINAAVGRMPRGQVHVNKKKKQRCLKPEKLGLQQGTMGNGKHVLAFLMRERNEFNPVPSS